MFRDDDKGLHISNSVAFNSTAPCVLQCFAFMCALSDRSMQSPPKSTRRKSPRIREMVDKDSGGKRSKKNEGGPRNTRSKFSNSPFDKGGTAGGAVSSKEFPVSPDNFQLGKCLGRSRSTLYTELSYGIALKLVDMSQSKELGAEIEHEERIYKHLHELQGTYILKLVWGGSWEGIFRGIGLSPIGSTPKCLSLTQKQHVIKGLTNIHSRRVLHGDIKAENILVDEEGTPFIIDFGLAVLNASKDRLHREMSDLLSLLDRSF